MKSQNVKTFQLTDRLHVGRMARVSADGIVGAESAWLAELDTSSTMVDDLARVVRNGDWTAAHAIAEYLSIDVAMAA
jgi:hypothetical protein